MTFTQYKEEYKEYIQSEYNDMYILDEGDIECLSREMYYDFMSDYSGEIIK